MRAHEALEARPAGSFTAPPKASGVFKPAVRDIAKVGRGRTATDEAREERSATAFGYARAAPKALSGGHGTLEPTAREAAKEAPTSNAAVRRRMPGTDVAAATKEAAAKKKLPSSSSSGEQAGSRLMAREPASPSSQAGLPGTSSSSQQAGQNSPLTVQQKGSPQRRQSPVQLEEHPCLPVTGAVSAPVGPGSPGAATSPRGDISSTKVKELEARLPPTAKVRELESRLSASTQAQVREVEARLPASGKAIPTKAVLRPQPQVVRASRSRSPDLGWLGLPPGLDAADPPTSISAAEASPSAETDSFDEEVELLRCQAELVEAAAELGTTSADDDFLTTDPEQDDDEDGMSSLPFRASRRGQLGPSVVIEEDDEGMTDDGQDDAADVEAGSEMRGRLWAQSLLRLKRSIDEIYSLCEYESDEIMCEQVREILMTASQDFVSLMKRFETQQEYALLPSEPELKTGVAWSTRMPKASNANRSGESPLELLERAQSPSSTSGRSTKDRPLLKADSIKRRANSLDPHKNRQEQADCSQQAGTGEASGNFISSSRDSHQDASREDNLQSMVQSALQRIESRLGRPSKLAPEELSKRSEERQRRAQQLRAEQEEQRMHKLRQQGNRVVVAREIREQKEQDMQVVLLEKMTKARRQYQDQLRSICERARKQNRKADEVAYVAKESRRGEREIMRRKQENARLARALLREEMRKKLLQSANRVAKVGENKRRQQEDWQQRVLQELEEKDRLASQRRKQHIHTIKLKSQEQETRSGTVREKRREIQEEDERSVLQQQQDFVHFRTKNMGRLALNVDGLPDGVREEVSEQLHAAVEKPSPGRNRMARAKAVTHGRCSTPPRRSARSNAQSESLKSSPKSDIVEIDLDEDLDDDLEPHTVQQVSSSMARKLRKARPKPRPAAKPVAAPYADDTADTSTTTNMVDSFDTGNCTGAGPEDTRCYNENAGMHEAAQSGWNSDGTDEQPFSDQDGSEGGDPINTNDGDLSSMLPSTPQDGSSPAKLGSRAKAKPEPKDIKHRRSTSPPDAGAAQLDNDQQVLGSISDDMYLEALRKQLSTEALSDEEALKVVTQSDASRTAGVNAAHRARISKLATDLGRVIPLLGNTFEIARGAVGEEQLGAHSLDLERADAVLAEFCKVLDQSQRDADYALVMQLGCVGKVMDICSRIKDSIGQSGAAERNMPPAVKQISSVMLSALKWLGLLSKQKISRMFLLLTNRVVLLADIAVACLATTHLLDTQSMPSLFLPQVLHILSLHVKQTLPDDSACFRQKLVSYLLVCGLAEKLRDLFKGAGLRGMRLFDGASPAPLLLLRAMCFLGTLVSAYRPPLEGAAETNVAPSGEEPMPAQVRHVLRRTDLFGIVSVLGTIICPDMGKPSSSQNSERGKLPQTVTSLAVQAVRILNHCARIHLESLQEAVYQQEFQHLLVSLLDYCALHHQGPKPGQGQGQDENELLHESVVLLGNYCLLHKKHQELMCYGEGQPLLTKITSLPLYYFMDEKGKLLLFPTILATCFESEQNLELLRNEINLSMLGNFLAALLAQGPDDARLPEAAANGFGGRFPRALWPRALEFFSEEATARDTSS